ncbi:RNA polymerase-binding protein DksA [Eleftheria terrae]|uniref:RNA polymerase-binding protein DksA n=1 Tax=Eleftheria terrae TaxID=1597781 RepID=UPI00263BE62C|nr:RNA polymerase-binding protein DksA [Eleftheria terrae]WKB54855.1 RNA polymerase-binding protein DksA [Eleftheria terrae]
MSKTPAQRISSAQPATEPLPAGEVAGQIARAPQANKAAAAQRNTAAKASKAPAVPAQEPDESDSDMVSPPPATPKPGAKKATTDSKSAAPRRTAGKAGAAQAPAEAPESVPALSSAPATAGRATSGTSMTPSSATAVLDQPRPTMPQADPKLANAWKNKPGRELSDAEVLAMPEAEYMSDKQLEFFRAKLESLKEDLLSNAGETTEHLREDTSIVPDPADRATIEEEHALELRTRDRERKLLKKISQALARIDAGDYGFCDETGEPIGLGRLIARPTATLSLEAQQRRELKQKLFGD